MTAITIWIPALRNGAPSNAAGMAPGGPYRTRKEALHHEHYANHAGFATAKRVSVHDGTGYVDGFDGEELALQVCEHDDSACVAAHLAAKRWASAIKAALGYLSASAMITVGDRSIAWLVEGAPRTAADTAASLRRLGLRFVDAPLLALDTDPWDPADTYWNAGLGEWTRPALPVVEIAPDA